MISCQAIYNDVVATMGTGTGNLKLNDAFPRAVNRALDELSIASDQPTKFPHVTATSDSVAALDDHYEYILYAGTLYWLIRMGYKPGDPKTARLVYEDTESVWAKGRADFCMDQDNILQSNPQNNVVGIRLRRRRVTDSAVAEE